MERLLEASMWWTLLSVAWACSCLGPGYEPGASVARVVAVDSEHDRITFLRDDGTQVDVAVALNWGNTSSSCEFDGAVIGTEWWSRSGFHEGGRPFGVCSGGPLTWDVEELLMREAMGLVPALPRSRIEQAIDARDPDALRAAISDGAEVNLATVRGSLLRQAMGTCDATVVEPLALAGAQLHARRPPRDSQPDCDNDFWVAVTPLLRHDQIFGFWMAEAIAREDMELLTALLDQGALSAGGVGRSGGPWAMALTHGSWRVVELLRSSGFPPPGRRAHQVAARSSDPKVQAWFFEQPIAPDNATWLLARSLHDPIIVDHLLDLGADPRDIELVTENEGVRRLIESEHGAWFPRRWSIVRAVNRWIGG